MNLYMHNLLILECMNLLVVSKIDNHGGLKNIEYTFIVKSFSLLCKNKKVFPIAVKIGTELFLQCFPFVFRMFEGLWPFYRFWFAEQTLRTQTLLDYYLLFLFLKMAHVYKRTLLEHRLISLDNHVLKTCVCVLQQWWQGVTPQRVAAADWWRIFSTVIHHRDQATAPRAPVHIKCKANDQ